MMGCGEEVYYCRMELLSMSVLARARFCLSICVGADLCRRVEERERSGRKSHTRSRKRGEFGRNLVCLHLL